MPLVDRTTSFDIEHLTAVVKHPDVQAYIKSQRKASCLLKTWPSLYIVTGVRMAKGARMKAASAATASNGAGVSADAGAVGAALGLPFTTNTSVGALAETSRRIPAHYLCQRQRLYLCLPVHPNQIPDGCAAETVCSWWHREHQPNSESGGGR